MANELYSNNVSKAAYLTAGAVGMIGAYAVWSLTRPAYRPPDSAPARTRGRSRYGDYTVVGRTVTINRPRAEIYRFWRDFSNLSAVMENIERVEPLGEQGHRWTIAAPFGQSVEIETDIVTERDDELIAWRSRPGSQIDTEGRVSFRDAPDGRGTEVEAIIAYDAPGGEIGRLVAKLFQREPAIQCRHDLKRLKMLLETGEIATSRNHRIEDHQKERA